MRCPKDINEYLRGVNAFDRLTMSFSNRSIVIALILIVYLINRGIMPYYKYVCNPLNQ